MKKLFSLLALLLLLSCDDGDMTFKTFNFDNPSPQKCDADSNILYITSGSEVLILDIDNSNFANVPSEDSEGTIVTLTAGQLRYLNYSGSVSNTTLCSDVPVASPQIIEEWASLPGGTVQIQTVANVDEGILTGYNHVITLVSVTFIKGEESIVINNNQFGTYRTNLDYTFDFDNQDVQVQKCPNSDNVLYKLSGTEALYFDLDDINELFVNAATPAETPRVKDIDATTNTLVLEIFNGPASQANVCGTTQIPPYLQNIWTATEGQLQVTSEFVAPNYEHTVKLVGVKFVNNQNNFETFTVDQYIIGKYITAP
jgi:hypothetical protein